MSKIRNIQKITVWIVKETVDEHGRLGGTVGIFSTATYARDASRGRGWYGGNANIATTSAIRIDNEIYVLEGSVTQPVTLDLDIVTEQKHKRIAALAKLTAEEKKLLNLKDD